MVEYRDYALTFVPSERLYLQKQIKIMNLKKWTLLVAMMGVLLVTAFAIDGNEVNQDRIEMMQKRKAFFKENIKPKIDAQRKKLDASISANDKKEITKLRAEIVKQKLIQNELMFEHRKARINGEELNEDDFQKGRTQRLEIEKLYDQAKVIANNYRPEIDDLIADLKQEMRGQQSKMGSKKGNSGGKGMGKGKGQMQHKSFGNNCQGNGPGSKSGMHKGFGHGSQKGMTVVKFLLWDENRGS